MLTKLIKEVMKNKRARLVSIPFILIGFIILILVWFNLLDGQIGVKLIFICLGCQQLFIGLIAYKEDKKTRKAYILFGVVCFLTAFWLVLKSCHLI